MPLTFADLKKELSPEGRLKIHNQELSSYIKKNVKGKTEFVISEFVAHGKGIKKPFYHKSVTKKEYIEYLKEKFQDEKDYRILSRGC